MSDNLAQLSEPMTLMRTKDVKHLADRIEELEAKLAKAVEALKHIEHYDIHAPTHARNILKELTGGKDE